MTRWSMALAGLLVGACTNDPQGGGAGIDASAPTPVYVGDVDAIVRRHCTPCHRDDGPAPFPLARHEQLVARAEQVRLAVAARLMPPFPPDDEVDDCVPLADFRDLPPVDRERLIRWLDAGAPRGGDGPELPLPVATSPLGPPDLTIAGPAPYASPATVDDEYRCFVVDPGLTAWTPLRSAWVSATVPRAVHHAVLFAALPAATAAIDAKDAADPAPGFACYGGTGVADVFAIGGYAPGAVATGYADDTAVWLPAGTRFVVEMHYHRNHAPNQLRVELWRASPEVRRLPRGAESNAFDFRIPAGAPSVVATTAIDVIAAGATPADATEVGEGLAWGVSMHMHLLGKTGRIDLVHADGRRRCLLTIPRWSDDWQGGYGFAAPVPLVAGDRIEARCEWDNSPGHQPLIDGVRGPPRDVGWGFGVRDEMCTVGVTVTDPRP